MTNPLLQKYEELYGKKEPPKMPRIEDYEGEETIADELKKLRDTSTIPVSKIKSCDVGDLKVSFQQIAEKIKNGEAQVSSMSMERNAHLALNKITFEVMVYEP
jgi:hypothetical protein